MRLMTVEVTMRCSLMLVLAAVAAATTFDDTWQEADELPSEELVAWRGENRAAFLKALLGAGGAPSSSSPEDDPLSYANVKQGKSVQVQLHCGAASARTAGATQSTLNLQALMTVHSFSQKGQSSTVYKMDQNWLLKLPIDEQNSKAFGDEYKATEMLSTVGLNVPETFLCTATDASGNNPMAALVKAMLTGYDLSDVMIALSTTEVTKKTKVSEAMTVHPECALEEHGEPMQMSADEYNKFKQMGGSRWTSFWSQRISRNNRRTGLGNAVESALKCAYEKLAIDNVAMMSTPHLRYFGDLKPDNFRWGMAPGDATEKLYAMDTTLFTYEVGSGAEEERLQAETDKLRKAQYGASWKQVALPWMGMQDGTEPSACRGPHWNAFSPEFTAAEAKTKFKDSCPK